MSEGKRAKRTMAKQLYYPRVTRIKKVRRKNAHCQTVRKRA